MTPEEFDEWKTYYSFEPWGSPTEDDRFRKLYQLNWYRKEGGFDGDMLEYFLLDRDPEETERLRIERENNIDPVDDLIMFMTARVGGDDEPD